MRLILATLAYLFVGLCAQEFIEINVFEGEVIKMDCNDKELPGLEYKYTWLKDSGTPVSYAKIYSIDRATMSSAGLYYCTTLRIMNRNIELPTTQRIFSVTVKALAPNYSSVKPEIVITGLESDYSANSLLLLQCQVTQVRDPDQYMVVWKFPDGTIMSQSTLYESPITRFGRYQCVVTDRNSGTEYTKDANVINRDAPKNDEVNLQAGQTYNLRLEKNPANLRIGYPARIECVVTPAPPPGFSLILYRNDQPIAYDGVYNSPALAEEDIFARWKCELTVSGQIPTSNDVTLVDITKTRETQMSVEGSIVGVKEGDTFELHCEVDFGTASQVTWTFQNNPFTPPYRNIEFTYTNELAALTITGATTNNQGRYECRTVSGEVKYAIVYIIATTVEFEINPTYRELDAGASMEFHCSVPTSQTITSTDLQWFYLGDSPSNSERPIPRGWDTNTIPNLPRSLFIVKRGVEVSDTGYYLCRHRVRDNFRGVSQLVVRGAALVITVTMEPRRYEARTNEYFSVTFTCNAYNNGAPYTTDMFWRFIDGRDLGYDSRFRVNGNVVTFSGTFTRVEEIRFQCGVRTVSGEITDDGYITVIQGGCDSSYQFTCGDGTCIDMSRRCNGARDCIDGSDEDPQYCSGCDPVEKKCEFYNGRAPIKQIYAVHWECDGEDDCGNGFDERNCRNVGAVCGGTQYRCGRDFPERLIPFAFLCDSEYDCQGGEDENVCQGAPTIVSTEPVSEISTRVGDTVVLRGTAEGFPVPRVIWRYNWRCLPDENRMVVENSYDGSSSSCRTTRSSLTIRNVKVSDGGLYNCEALSGNKRAMSQAIRLTVRL